MAVTLKYIAQYAMDSYYKDFKGNTGFFELNDFIFRAGAVISDYYQKMYDAKYAELRQEKKSKDELVGIDPDLLSVQQLIVKENKATITYPVMSFLSDKSGVGYQFVLPVKPSDAKFERSSMDEVWVYAYLPKTNRVFWRPQNGSLLFFKNSICTINAVDLYYIPSVIDKNGEVIGDALIPDALMNMAVNGTVMTMRQLEANFVVKTTNDLNENKIMETEINKEALK